MPAQMLQMEPSGCFLLRQALLEAELTACTPIYAYSKQVSRWSSGSWTGHSLNAIYLGLCYTKRDLGLVGRGCTDVLSCVHWPCSQFKLLNVQPGNSSWSPTPSGDPWGLGSVMG